MRQAPIARAVRTLLVLLSAGAGITCRDAGLTGPGRLAPTSAALAFVPRFTTVAGVPIAPYRTAHVELFTIPANALARETSITFVDGDTTSTFSLDVTITEVNQRFLLALTLFDDQGRIVYQARDTVVAFTPGTATPPPPTVISLVYAGPDTAVASLAIAPRDTVVGVGDLVRYRAVARRADGSIVPGVTVGFSARGAGIDVAADGTVRATAATIATVIARLATGRSDSTAITVAVRGVAARILLRPDTAVSLPVNATLLVTADPQDATGTSIGRPVTWRSSDTTIVRLTSDAAERELVVGRSPGTASITATLDGVIATLSVRVTAPVGPASVTISPSTVTLASIGELAALAATVRDASGATLPVTASWTSRDTSVVTVTSSGQVQARRNGAAWVVATASPAADSARITVRQLVDTVVLSRDSLILALGDTATVRATLLDRNRNVIADLTATFMSADTTVATVSAVGLVRLVASGSTQVTGGEGGHSAALAVRRKPPTGPASVSITPATVTLASIGELAALAATVRDASGTLLAITPTWTSRDTSVVTVTASGQVQARGNGATWVTATASPASDSARITVRQVVDTVVLSRDSLVLALGDTATVRATLLDRNRNVIPDRSAAFTSVDTAVATVTAAGLVRVVGSGTTQVTASAGGHSAALLVRLGQGSGGVTAGFAYIRITPGSGTVRMGGTQQLVAELVDARGVATTISPAWASDEPGRASVDAAGIATFVDTTTATITASQRGIAGHALFRVLAAPAMTSFTFAPRALTGASTSTVRFSVSIGAADPGNGVGMVTAEFTGPTGATASCSVSAPVVGTANRGYWDCAIALPPGSATGTWHATRITLAGTIARTLDESQLSTYGPTTLTVAP
jgi:hypothetical protein